MDLFGLIGYPLSHSFSKKYFTKKFEREKINASYELFPIEKIEEVKYIISQNPNLKGFNVTIPYKETIIPFLDEIDDAAKEIGAVNTVKIQNNRLIGYNTDIYGFEKSFLSFCNNIPKKALILGTGGSSKAVSFILKKYNFDIKFVSRSAGDYTYNQLSEEILKEFKVIINTTPLGMFPKVENCPDIPYEFLMDEHYLFDLVYNPEETLFLKKGKDRGAKTKNGLDMLHFQAEKAWEVWNKKGV